MRRSGVTLVVGKAIARIEPVVLDHRVVARDLGHDAGGHDRGAGLVAPDHRHLGQRRVGDVEGVDQQVFRLDAQTRHRAGAREDAGFVQPSLSTWAWSTAHTETATARRRMIASTCSRSSALKSLESLRPGIRSPTRRTTAPPTTGPAR